MLEILQKENFYGHRRRLYWILERINKTDHCIDVGCGTGSIVTLPLAFLGYNIVGVDISPISIDGAKKHAKENNINPEIFFCDNIDNISQKFDVVILAEVLEHIETKDQKRFLDALINLVRSDGKIIITVPNGNGSFERGKRNWEKYWGKAYNTVLASKFYFFLQKLKWKFVGKPKEKIISHEDVMSLSQTPHVQFFDFRDIPQLLSEYGFVLKDYSGSAMFSGVIINSFFPRNQYLCKINCQLARCFPKISSGYYYEFTRK